MCRLFAAPAAREVVRTRHHESPRYIYGKGRATVVEKAPVINHRDEELILLESLVGRMPAFLQSQIDEFGTSIAFKRNVELEYQRNVERYQFLRWGQQAFNNMKVVPPGTVTSVGQVTSEPVHVSSASHGPRAERQTVAGAATPSAGQTMLAGVQLSATSQAPACPRQITVGAANDSPRLPAPMPCSP